jgi:hypothetical protein
LKVETLDVVIGRYNLKRIFSAESTREARRELSILAKSY